MAVRGLDLFCRYFAEYEDAFLLIGGAACDVWFAEQGLGFRATADMDIVLVVEAVSADFVHRFHSFVDEGNYRNRTRNEDGSPELYRFEKPEDASFPKELELFTRGDELRDLRRDQRIIPIRIEDAESLSAILLDDEYYRLIMDNRRESQGIWMANAASLIPLKARAWLDLTARKTRGQSVDTKKIKKHRRDVFALAATLPSERGPNLPKMVLTDLRQFYDVFDESHEDWRDILKSISGDIGGSPPPRELRDAIALYFGLVD